MTTRTEWAQGFLSYCGYESSIEKITALVAHAAEVNTDAAFNPLGVIEPAPGSAAADAMGTRAYPNLWAGYAATLTTLFYKHPDLTAQLSDPAGGSAATYATADSLRALGRNCLFQVEALRAGDPDHLATVEIGETMPELSEAAEAPPPAAPESVLTPEPAPEPAPAPEPEPAPDPSPGSPAPPQEPGAPEGTFPPMPPVEEARPGYLH